MYGPTVSKVIDKMEVDHLLDYGCGSNLSLPNAITTDREFIYQAYDPGVEKFSGDPSPAQLVCCIDVLEHIEPEYLEDVLDHLEELTEEILFCSVTTEKAMKTLPDGRNAHLIVQPMSWWLPKIMERFEVQTVQLVTHNNFFVIAHNADLTPKFDN
jgi:hypothetical protein